MFCRWIDRNGKDEHEFESNVSAAGAAATDYSGDGAATLSSGDVI